MENQMSDRPAKIITATLCLLLVGCASTPTPDIIPTTEVPSAPGGPPIATADPATEQAAVMKTAWAVHWAGQTQTAQAKPTRTPQPEGQSLPTSVPTVTPLPTGVPIATPSGILSTSGPWLVARNMIRRGTDEEYLWAANPDLSGLTRLIPEPVIAYAIRPIDTIGGGLTIAYATRSCRDCIDITLKIVTLPGGGTKTIASLYQAAAGSEFSQYFLTEALTSSGLVWSPDGRTLAFAGGLSGLSVDAYTYSLDTGKIIQLSDGPLQAYQLRWSPDGRYIIYEGSDMMGMGGPYTQAIWSVPAGGGTNISLVDEDLGYFDFGGPVIYGWHSSTQILLGAVYYEERDSILAVNIETGNAEVIAQAQYERGAYSEKHQTWLLVRTYEVDTLGPALILCRNGNCQVVSSEKMRWVWWSINHDAFFSLSEQGVLYKITAESELTRLPVKLDEYAEVRPSPDGTIWAWHAWGFYEGSTKIYLGQPLTQPHVLSVDPLARIHQVTWSPDSQHLLLFGENSTYIASQPDFKPVLAIEGWTATDITWVQ
jgi:hypothetical protein